MSNNRRRAVVQNLRRDLFTCISTGKHPGRHEDSNSNFLGELLHEKRYHGATEAVTNQNHLLRHSREHFEQLGIRDTRATQEPMVSNQHPCIQLKHSNRDYSILYLLVRWQSIEKTNNGLGQSRESCDVFGICAVASATTEVQRCGPVAALLQQSDGLVPAPGAMGSSVHQQEVACRGASTSCNLHRQWNSTLPARQCTCRRSQCAPMFEATLRPLLPNLELDLRPCLLAPRAQTASSSTGYGKHVQPSRC